MLQKKPKSQFGDASGILADIQSSRDRQARLQDKMDRAYASGDHILANIHAGDIKKEMENRTSLHKKAATIIPSYKSGGKVKETGLALVHKGETVIPAKEKDMDEKPKSRAAKAMSSGDKKADHKKKSDKKKKRKVHRMELRHAANGGYIATHHYKSDGGPEPMPEPEDHALMDIDQLHSHMDEHMSPEEEAAPEPEQPPMAPPQGAM